MIIDVNGKKILNFQIELENLKALVQSLEETKKTKLISKFYNVDTSEFDDASIKSIELAIKLINLISSETEKFIGKDQIDIRKVFD